MMRTFFLYLIFLSHTIITYAQNSTGLAGKNMASPANSQWNLDKYVWSHSHSGPPGKPLIDFDAIDKWVNLVGDRSDLAISPDGNYFAYGYGNYSDRRLDTLVVQSTGDSWRESFGEASPGFFSGDSKQYIFTDKKRGLCFLHTGTGQHTYIKDVNSYKIPEGGKNEWLAYQRQDLDKTVVLLNLLTGKEEQFKNISTYSFDNTNQWLACKTSNAAKELLIYRLNSGNRQSFNSVVDYLFSKDGTKLLLKSDDDLKYVNLYDGKTSTIWLATDTMTKLSSFNFSESGQQVVFTTTAPAYANTAPAENSVWYWKVGMDQGILIADNQTTGLGNNVFIQGPAAFTQDGQCILLSLQEAEPELRQPEPNAVQVDVWSYQDTILQCTQLYQVKDPIIYKAIINAESGLLIWRDNKFEKLYFPYIKDYVLVGNWPENSKPLKHGDRFWEKDYRKDSIWLVSLKDGSRLFFGFKKMGGIYDIKPSPDGRYIVYYDRDKGFFFSYDVFADKHVNICAGIPAGQLAMHSFISYNKLYGTNKVYWLPGDTSLLVYDDYDIWQLDPAGKRAPVNITNGYGRKHKILFRVMDEGNGWVKRFGSSFFCGKDTLLLETFNMQTKFNGYYRKRLGASGDPELLCMGPYFTDMVTGTYGLDGGMPPLKAAHANTWVIKKESDTAAPNYFVTKDLKTLKALTNLQPHNEYNWLTAELHSFKRMDGTIAQGILYKPENFDSTKKYPVIVSFYISLSDRRYQYPQAQYIEAPNLKWGLAWMVSHGYVVFMPDILFTKDQYGPSTVNTMDGAARYLNSLPYVDHNRIGACGHSNSGRFGYYLLTHSHAFAAMCVSSVLGGTDILTGALTLSKNRGDDNLLWAEIDADGAALGPIWKNKSSWIDHIAVLQADKVKSPFLMMYNNNDGYRFNFGEELYISLRRLEKPSWWLQYDYGDHTVSDRDARDFTIRFTQFFDHYLKGAPPPSWMSRGIPAKLKGIEARYELDPLGSCAMQGKTECKVCKKWNVQYKRTPEMFVKPIAEWKLDDDLQKQMEKEETEKYNENMKGEAQRIKENNARLKAISK